MLYLLAYFALLLVILWRLRAPIVRFDFVATSVWFFAICLNFVPLIEYGKSISISTVLLVVAGHTALVFGFNLTTSKDRSRLRYEGDVGRASFLLSLGAAFFVLASLSSQVLAGRIPLVGSLTGIAERRQSYLDGELSLGLIDVVVGWARYPAMLFVCLLPLFVRRSERVLLSLAVLTLVSLADYSFSIGQRSTIVFSLLAILVAFLIIYQPKLTRGLLVSVAFVPVIYWFGSSFYLARSADFGVDPEHFLALNCAGADFGSLTQEQSLEVKAFTLSSCYFSSPVVHLDQFVEDNHRTWQHSYGKYNAGVIFVSDFNEERASIEKYYSRQGHATNPWTTGIRDYWLDFGEFSFVMFFATGISVGVLQRRRCLLNEFQLARTCLLALIGFLIPFLSPLIIRAVIYPIAASIVLQFISRLLTSSNLIKTQTTQLASIRRPIE